MNERGKWGELLVQQHLQKKSYLIVKNNFRCSTGEVDIIYIENDILVFAEVKTWQYHRYEELEYVISWKKRRRMIKTAMFFLDKYKNYYSMNIRFDVILLLLPTMRIHHLRNVFE